CAVPVFGRPTLGLAEALREEGISEEYPQNKNKTFRFHFYGNSKKWQGVCCISLTTKHVIERLSLLYSLHFLTDRPCYGAEIHHL
ncbi:MAG TPA: hypothetical protein VGE32_09900, partial [Cellvibrio sp.]